MPISAYPAGRCDLSVGYDRYVASLNWPAEKHGTIAIQIEGEDFVAALDVNHTVAEQVDPSECVTVISSGETNCEKAKQKYGID